jgi:hypothetical protein
VGGAFTAAWNWVDTTPGVSEHDAVNPVHALVQNPSHVAPVVNTAWTRDAGLRRTGAGVLLWGRPPSVHRNAGGPAQIWGTLGHAMSNVDDWREAWNRSADISFGQAVIDFNSTSRATRPGQGDTST